MATRIAQAALVTAVRRQLESSNGPTSTVNVVTTTVADSLLSILNQQATPTQSMDANDPPSIETSPDDQYLAILPSFMYSLPVQIICMGTTITLLGVLMVHLLFTVRYHWPLSKLNYALQTSSVAVWMVIVSYQLGYIFKFLWNITRSSPFVFDYIEILVPPDDWADWRLGIWYTVQAASNAAVHATHIQFLTLLFPSGLEKKLILSFLGPLACISSVLYYTDLSPNPIVQDLGDAIRNTANSSLTLLYTLALFIWGIFLNRRRAWRTDGGTAAFGMMSLFLGICSTSINFYEVSEDRMRWLPGLISCGLLWQSWVGFWWWVGAGMWTGEANDIERRERKKAKRAEKKRLKAERRLLQQQQQQQPQNASSSGHAASSGQTGLSGRLFRRRTNATVPENVELQPMGASANPSNNAAAVDADQLPNTTSVHIVPGETTSSTASTPATTRLPALIEPIYALFRPWLSHLREAHDAAALERAADPSAPPDSLRRSYGLQALVVHGRRERESSQSARANALAATNNHAATAAAADGNANAVHADRHDAADRAATRRMRDFANRGTRVDATDAASSRGGQGDDADTRRAEFMVDGGQTLQDEDDDDDDDAHDDDEDHEQRRQRDPRRTNVPSPLWRRAVNRWRLKDVSRFD